MTLARPGSEVGPDVGGRLHHLDGDAARRAYTVTEEDRAGWTPQGAASADFTVGLRSAVPTATPSSTSRT